jgi:hypothetical protein
MKNKRIEAQKFDDGAQRGPLIEHIEQENLESYDQNSNLPDSNRNKLIADFDSYNLGAGDTLRIIDTTGQMYDVLYAPDGQHIGIQQLDLVLKYGKMNMYPGWDEAYNAIQDKNYEVYSVQGQPVAPTTGQVGKASLNALRKATLENENPYRSNKWQSSNPYLLG